jgi:SagB-type dehydrogenase family enzyme
VSTWLLITIPLGLGLAVLAFPAIAGRRLRRADVDLVLALILLAYFLMTAGLGVFWVAKQELPVFDLHYLLGYVTTAFVLVHVAMNWPRIAGFFRPRGAPRRPPADRARWRLGGREVGWLFVAALAAAVAFWLGVRYGARTIVVSTRPAIGGSAPAARRDPLPRQWIESDGTKRTLAVYYHQETAHTEKNLWESGPINWSLQPTPFKDYPGAPRVALPLPAATAHVSTGDAIRRCRRRVDRFDDTSLSLEDLATLLFMTNGITKELRYADRRYLLRAAPSAGALYPTVTYVAVRDVAGIAPGLYYYSPREDALCSVRSGREVTAELAAIVPEDALVARAPATLVFTSVFPWTSWKYRERSYRYCGLDAGHLAVQSDLAAAALGLRGRPVGRFDDVELAQILGITGTEEYGMLILPIGRPGDQPTGQERERLFAPAPRDVAADHDPLMFLAHGLTDLAVTEELGPRRQRRSPEDKAYPGRAVIALPRDFAVGDDLFAAIRGRRSLRDWAGEPLARDELSALLYFSFGLDAAEGARRTGFDVSVEDNHAIRLYVVVNDVTELAPGVYYYDRSRHALLQLRAGDYRGLTQAAALNQEVVGGAQAVVLMSIDHERLAWPDGDRGYRYATLDAGMLGGRLYLQSVALQLGCCGIGAYFDHAVNELVEVDASSELVIYLVALGVSRSLPRNQR